MRKCNLYRLNIDETFETNCPNCVFNDRKNNKCKYNSYVSGIKKEIIERRYEQKHK